MSYVLFTILSGNASKFTSACFIFSPLYVACSLVTPLLIFKIIILLLISSHFGVVAKPNIFAALLAISRDIFAIPFVKALSSTFYAHSSAPTTFFIW